MKRCVFDLFKVLNIEQKKEFSMTVWALWKCGNDKIWNEIVKPISVSLQMALDQLYAWEPGRL